jgi:fibronectin type 3 domain-containing protein
MDTTREGVGMGRSLSILLIIVLLAMAPLGPSLGNPGDGPVGEEVRSTVGPLDDPVEWRDDFLDSGKMVSNEGFDVAGGRAVVNFSKVSLKADSYSPFPRIMLMVDGDILEFESSGERGGYSFSKKLTATYVKSVLLEDLDLDGHLDMVVVQGYDNNNPGFCESELWWGDGTGGWSKNGKETFNARGFRRCATGDFNGDGLPDLVFVQFDSGGGLPKVHEVFLNQGNRDFNKNADVQLSLPSPPGCWGIDAGDLNNDKYDDIVICRDDGEGSAYFGGLGGPDNIRDIHFKGFGANSYRILIRDLDRDGYQDVITAGGISLYYGGPNGPDNIADLQGGGNSVKDVQVGDFNGDGFNDVSMIYGGTLRIVEGNSTGWYAQNGYNLDGYAGGSHHVLDIDRDGYDDIIAFQGEKLKIQYGGTERFEMTPDESIPYSEDNVTWDIVPVVPFKPEKGYPATFITKNITRPPSKKWDILDLDGTLPAKTTVKISILDGQGEVVSGFKTLLGTNIDLSGLGEMETIRVQVTVTSRTNETAPVLDRLLVNWMDETVWREEFYGVAKVTSISGLDVRDDELRRAQDAGGPAEGSYLSKAFGPSDPRNATSFHTLRYTAQMGLAQSGQIRLVDASTYHVLAETPLRSGTNEWDLTGAFSLKDHPLIRVNVTVDGLNLSGAFVLDDIWINWTPRVNLPPMANDLWLFEGSVERTKTVELFVNATDEYDDVVNLTVVVLHSLQGSDVWSFDLYNPADKRCEDGLWVFPITPAYNAPLGIYTFKVNVTDKDNKHSGYVEFPATLEVLPDLPGAPRDLHAVGGDSMVELEWRPPWEPGDSPILGYRIYRGPTNASLQFLFTTGSLSITYVDEQVENGQTYWYGVLAYTEFGNGAISDPVMARPVGPPTAPLNLSAERGDKSVTLRWGPPENDGGFPLTSYYVYKGPTELQLEWEESVQGREHTLTGLVNGQTYYFAVSARTDVDEGPMTEPVAAIPGTIPGAPRDLSASPGTGEVRLSWKSPSDSGGFEILEYVIYRGEAPDSLERLVSRPVSSLYTDSEVDVGVTYYYAVTAVTTVGEGPMTEVVSSKPIGRPGMPRNITAEPGDNQITLSWEAPDSDGGSPVTSYIIMRGDTPEALGQISQVLGTITSYLDEEVENGQAHFYAVIAVNEVGEGPPTGAVRMAPRRPDTVPSKVLDLNGEAKGGKVELTWLPPLDNGSHELERYWIFRGESRDNMSMVVSLDGITNWTDDDVKRGTTYFYWVMAVNWVGQGEPSEVEVKVPKKKDEGPAFSAMVAILTLMVVVQG